MNKLTVLMALLLGSFAFHANAQSNVSATVADSLALVQLYHATGGPNWTTNTGWLQPGVPLQRWHGVAAGNPPGENQKRVLVLDLAGNNLSGALPDIFHTIDKVAYVELARNNLTGTIPRSVRFLKRLQYFYLEFNQMTGAVPGEFGQLPDLRVLSLAGNNFTSVEPGLGQSKTLSILALSNNQLHWLPEELGNLPKSLSLECGNNRLLYVPAELGRLRELRLNNNQLLNLPNFTDNTPLEQLHVFGNSLKFDDIERNLGAVKNPTMPFNFDYDPQDSVRIYADREGNKVTLSTEPVGGSNRTFTWYLNNRLIAGATDSIHVIPNINVAGNLLFEISNGQAFFEKVAVYDDKSFWNDADVRIYASNDQWPEAQLHGINLGRENFIRLPPKHFGSKPANVHGIYNDVDLDVNTLEHFSTLVHEFGHYALGFYDEYQGADKRPVHQFINFGFMDQIPSSGDMQTEMSAMEFFDKTFGHNVSRLDFLITDEQTGQPVPGAQVFVRKQRIRNGIQQIIDQGFADDQGRIRVLGAEVKDTVEFVNPADGELKFLATVLGPGGNALQKNRAEEYTFALKTVSGVEPFLSRVVFDAGGTPAYRLLTAQALAAPPVVYIYSDDHDPDRLQLVSAAGGYEARFAKEIPQPATLSLQAVDGQGMTFGVPHAFALYQVDSAKIDFISSGSQLRLEIESGIAKGSRIAVLGSVFPEPRSGLQQIWRRVSPVYSVDVFPAPGQVTGFMSLYYNADSLQPNADDALLIHRWENDR